MGDQRTSRISDHALLRYMERVLHINLAAMELAMEQAISQSMDFGDGFLLGPDGEYYRLSGTNVITVLTNEGGKAIRRYEMKRAHGTRLPDRGWAA